MTNSEIEINPPENTPFYHFGEFQLDSKRNILTRSGEPVSLTYKALRTLIVLVENQGRIVPKEEILERVWQDTFVEENSLTRNISVLRKILGEEPTTKRFIETVPRHGYRFVASVTKTATGENSLLQDTGEVLQTNENIAPGFSDQKAELRDEENALPSQLNPLISNSDEKSPINKLQIESTLATPKKVNKFFVVIFIIAGLGVIFFTGSKLIKPSAAGKPSVETPTLIAAKFTNIGKAQSAAISPDGKYVVYVADDGAQQSLWVRQTAAGNSPPIQILPSQELNFQGLAFSADSNYVYYNIWDRKGVGEIFRVPALGGVPTKIVHDCLPSIAVSPADGKIAFLRGYAAQNEQALITANADGDAEKQLIRLDSREWFMAPAWSPDGKTLAVALGKEFLRENGQIQIYEISAETGEQKVLSEQHWIGIRGISWLPDRQGLIVNGADETQNSDQIWRIELPGGEARKITSEATGYDGISSLTTDGTTLVSIQQSRSYNIWSASSDHPEEAHKITDGRNEGRGAGWTPDGKIVYTSVLDANPNIWIMEADGSHKKQLTGEKFVGIHPVVSAVDGSIFFLTNRSGNFQIWRMNENGQNLKQITNDFGGGLYSVSPDGKWLVYIKGNSGSKSTLWKISTDGGESRQLTKFYSYAPSISPDGKLIAYSLWDEDHNPPQWGREIISLEDGHRVKTFSLPETANLDDGAIQLCWLPDQSGIAYIDYRDKTSNVWVQPLDDKKPRSALTNFKDGRIFQFNWSPDGKKILFVRGNDLSDVVILKIS